MFRCHPLHRTCLVSLFIPVNTGRIIYGKYESDVRYAPSRPSLRLVFDRNHHNNKPPRSRKTTIPRKMSAMEVPSSDAPGRTAACEVVGTVRLGGGAEVVLVPVLDNTPDGLGSCTRVAPTKGGGNASLHSSPEDPTRIGSGEDARTPLASVTSKDTWVP